MADSLHRSPSGDALRGTGAELGRYISFTPALGTDSKYRFIVNGVDTNGQICMTVGSFGLDEGERMADMLRAFHVGLVLGAQRPEDVALSTKTYLPRQED